MDPGSGAALIIPSALVARIQEAAAAEHRPVADILRDALEVYLASRPGKLVSEWDLVEAPALGPPDEDVPITPEHRDVLREKIAQGVHALRTGMLTNQEALFARIEAELDEIERRGPQ